MCKKITRLEGKVSTLKQKVAALTVDHAELAVDHAALKKIVTDLKKDLDRFRAIRKVAAMMIMFSGIFSCSPHGSFTEQYSEKWNEIQDGEIPPKFEQEVKLLLENLTSLDESWSSDITLLMSMGAQSCKP